MLEITLTDSNFPHQNYLTPFINSKNIVWKRDGVRRKLNVYTDNFIKSTHVDIPQDDNFNICLLLEPYTNPPWTDIYDYIRTDYDKFDLIITHNLDKLGDLIEGLPHKFHYSTKCITTSWLDERFIGLHEKNKMISMPFSYKNFSEGHRIRHIIYEKYRNQNIIDFYGTGIEKFEGEFRNCFLDYKYVIVCENTLQDGFNSEKINDAMLSGCIPIYWGSKIKDNNYKQDSIFYFSPEKNKVEFDFSESLDNLDKLLKYVLDVNPYSSLYESIKNNFDYSLSTLNSEDNLYKVLVQRGLIN